MPLDPVTRRELKRLHARLGFGLALLGNPVGMIVSLLTGPAPNRPRRLVYVTADGDVTRTEELPPAAAVRPSTRGAHHRIDPVDGLADGSA